jgi:hypothetical protein
MGDLLAPIRKIQPQSTQLSCLTLFQFVECAAILGTNKHGPKTEEKIVTRQRPVRYMAVESCDEVRRNVFCRHYGECLNLAIRKRWPGFSCQTCESYEQERLDGEALNDDHARCIALAFVSGALDPMAGEALAS